MKNENKYWGGEYWDGIATIKALSKSTRPVAKASNFEEFLGAYERTAAYLTYVRIRASERR
ncbi:MAG: hypothetical protein LBF84_03550 [Holosporales bacterium]|nr:hypothetical protein [Holosporales bacterium]